MLKSRLISLAWLVGVGSVFAFAFGTFVAVVTLFTPSVQFPFLAQTVRLPHHVPEHKGGLSFRFAMVHDVLHERFPKHGPAWYEERNRLTQQEIDKLPADDPKRWPLIDDLTVALDRLGKPAEAVPVMRAKLESQQAAGVTGRELYTSYANLGTFLIHSNFAMARNGDAEAIQRFQEGIDFIRKSVEVNPDAHFGRERWQLAIAEFLLASMKTPELLKQYDCIGNRLNASFEDILPMEVFYLQNTGRATHVDFYRESPDRDSPRFFASDANPDDPVQWDELKPIRQYITLVGADEFVTGQNAEKDSQWAAAVPSHTIAEPFDEPMLGIIGMWRQGGGANPHFCLAIAETMLRTGQRHIAWAAYERASLLAERFSPDPGLQTFLRDHCKARQAAIEETFRPPKDRKDDAYAAWNYLGSRMDDAAIGELRGNMQSELKLGTQYQQAYQEYETTKIAAGHSIDDEHFFDDFNLQHGSIASKSGSEELTRIILRSAKNSYTSSQGYAWGTLGFGIGAIIAAACGYLRRWIMQTQHALGKESETDS